MVIDSASSESIHEYVRERYAAAALRARAATLLLRATKPSGGALFGARAGELPDAAVLASLGCGNPTAVAELREGERVLDLGSGGGIDVLLSAQPGRSDGSRLRARHDRRDARARPAQRRRGRRHQRRVPQGHDRGDPAARGLGRRRHQQLRRQPGRRQARRVPRDRARPPAGRSDRHHRHRRRGPPHAGGARSSAARTRAASRARCRSPSSARVSRPSACPTSRSPRRTTSPTGWSARSSSRDQAGRRAAARRPRPRATLDAGAAAAAGCCC